MFDTMNETTQIRRFVTELLRKISRRVSACIPTLPHKRRIPPDDNINPKEPRDWTCAPIPSPCLRLSLHQNLHTSTPWDFVFCPSTRSRTSTVLHWHSAWLSISARN